MIIYIFKKNSQDALPGVINIIEVRGQVSSRGQNYQDPSAVWSMVDAGHVLADFIFLPSQVTSWTPFLSTLVVW